MFFDVPDEFISLKYNKSCFRSYSGIEELSANSGSPGLFNAHFSAP